LDVVILENVQGLMVTSKSAPTSNLAECFQQMKRLGFEGAVALVDPRCYGSPQSRARLWMTFVKKAELERLGMSPSAFCKRFGEMMQRLSGIPIMALENALLPEDDALVVAHLRAASQSSRSSGHRDGDGEPSAEASQWHVRHQRAWAKKGVLWETRPPAERVLHARDIFPGVNLLFPREIDMLNFNGVEVPDNTLRVINLQPAIDRVRVLSQNFECITPKSRVWISSRSRFLLGMEALAVQGIHYGPQDSVAREWPDKVLMDLAGNAFHTGSCAAALVSVYAVLGLGTSASGVAPPSAPAAASECFSLADVWGLSSHSNS